MSTKLLPPSPCSVHGLVPKFARHGDVRSLECFECYICHKRLAIEDVKIPEGYCVSFNTTV